MNKWRRQCHQGIIAGYGIEKQSIAVYVYFYNRNKLVMKLTFKIKAWSLYHRLRKIPIYKTDGALDLESMEGMPVYVEMISCGRRVYVKKIAFDLAYYGLAGGKVIG